MTETILTTLCSVHAIEYYGVSCCSHFLISVDNTFYPVAQIYKIKKHNGCRLVLCNWFLYAHIYWKALGSSHLVSVHCCFWNGTEIAYDIFKTRFYADIPNSVYIFSAPHSFRTLCTVKDRPSSNFFICFAFYYSTFSLDIDLYVQQFSVSTFVASKMWVPVWVGQQCWESLGLLGSDVQCYMVKSVLYTLATKLPVVGLEPWLAIH